MSDDCWVWPYNKFVSGYGRLVVNGKTVRAHRASWEMANGPIPSGLCVLHKCDNRICFNPGHLFLGTPKDNVLDMNKKGRDRSVGSRNPRAKLGEEDVRQIKCLLRLGLKMPWIARTMSASYAIINAISTGKTWRCVS